MKSIGTIGYSEKTDRFEGEFDYFGNIRSFGEMGCTTLGYEVGKAIRIEVANAERADTKCRLVVMTEREFDSIILNRKQKSL